MTYLWKWTMFTCVISSGLHFFLFISLLNVKPVIRYLHSRDTLDSVIIYLGPFKVFNYIK